MPQGKFAQKADDEAEGDGKHRAICDFFEKETSGSFQISRRMQNGKENGKCRDYHVINTTLPLKVLFDIFEISFCRIFHITPSPVFSCREYRSV